MSVLTLQGVGQAAISFSVGGTAPTAFPGPVAPPANAPWGTNGYPGDTVQLLGFSNSVPEVTGSYTRQINTLQWNINYTYAGTATDPDAWGDLSFLFTATHNIDFGGPSGSLNQPGRLDVTWENDYLSLSDGTTTTFTVGGFQVDVTPLGFAPVGGSEFPGFPGGTPWAQPALGVWARFDVSEAAAAVPEPSTLIVWSLFALTIGGTSCWRRRKRAE